MSLIDEAMEPCIIMDKVTRDDGYGGVVTEYTEGAPFSAAISFDDSIMARTASAQGVTDLYTVTTRKNIVLQAQDVFKRVSDGRCCRSHLMDTTMQHPLPRLSTCAL